MEHEHAGHGTDGGRLRWPAARSAARPIHPGTHIIHPHRATLANVNTMFGLEGDRFSDAPLFVGGRVPICQPALPSADHLV